LDNAIRLRWALRDIKGKRLKLTPVDPSDIRVLIDMDYVEMINNEPSLRPQVCSRWRSAIDGNRRVIGPANPYAPPPIADAAQSPAISSKLGCFSVNLNLRRRIAWKRCRQSVLMRPQLDAAALNRRSPRFGAADPGGEGKWLGVHALEARCFQPRLGPCDRPPMGFGVAENCQISLMRGSEMKCAERSQCDGPAS
jgi:hypothetical protein